MRPSPLLPRTLPAALAIAAGAFAAACGGGDDAPAGGTPPTLPAAVSTAGAGMTIELEGEEFVSVRTEPAAALSAERLTPAGNAVAANGDETAMARPAVADGAEPWELVSAADEGWRIWRPASVLEVLDNAGAGGVLRNVEPAEWPDACLGLAETGEICATVITPGYRVTVEVNGTIAVYRASLRGDVRREP